MTERRGVVQVIPVPSDGAKHSWPRRDRFPALCARVPRRARPGVLGPLARPITRLRPSFRRWPWASPQPLGRGLNHNAVRG